MEGWSSNAYRDFEDGDSGQGKSDGSDREECQKLGGVWCVQKED